MQEKRQGIFLVTSLKSYFPVSLINSCHLFFLQVLIVRWWLICKQNNYNVVLKVLEIFVTNVNMILFSCFKAFHDLWCGIKCCFILAPVVLSSHIYFLSPQIFLSLSPVLFKNTGGTLKPYFHSSILSYPFASVPFISSPSF